MVHLLHLRSKASDGSLYLALPYRPDHPQIGISIITAARLFVGSVNPRKSQENETTCGSHVPDPPCCGIEQGRSWEEPFNYCCIRILFVGPPARRSRKISFSDRLSLTRSRRTVSSPHKALSQMGLLRLLDLRLDPACDLPPTAWCYRTIGSLAY